MAIKSILPPGTHFGTIHMEVDFLRPVTQGVVSARCTVKQVQERLWDARVAVEDITQTTVVCMQATFKVSRRRLDSANWADSDDSTR